MDSAVLGGINMIAGSKPKELKLEQTVLKGIEIIS
jgi:hypothetical protein